MLQVFLLAYTLASTQSQTNSLQIVVIEGENAVNIIQQKTAVAPIVEVRDRNNQPVAGATVRFVIQGGRATFGGAQTITVTTNSVGQAVAGAFTPISSGTVQISATAAFQGQSAIATIAQTNVMTAAEAVAGVGAASAGGSASAGTGTGAATSGAAGTGGLSATAIGLIGGAVAGGAAIATQTVGSSEETTTTTAPTTPTTTTATFTGAYRGSGDVVYRGTNASCVHSRELSGTLTVIVEQRPDGSVTGRVTTTTGELVVSVTTPQCSPTVIGAVYSNAWDTQVTGTSEKLTWSEQRSFVNSHSLGRLDGVKNFSFEGSVRGGELTGILKLEESSEVVSGTTLSSRGYQTANVTLRRQ